jgi:hypothetical protein
MGDLRLFARPVVFCSTYDVAGMLAVLSSLDTGKPAAEGIGCGLFYD